REELVTCARDVCPAFIRTDCTAWLPEVTSALPTIVIAPLDGDGRDLAGGVVSVDNKVVNAATGLEVPLDPGEHVVTLEAPAGRIRQRVVVRTGEKARRVELRLAKQPDVTSGPEPTHRSSVPWTVFALGGSAVVLGAAGGILWGVGSSGASAYNARCEST